MADDPYRQLMEVLSCPFCTEDCSDWTVTMKRVHYLWKHPIAYVNAKEESIVDVCYKGWKAVEHWLQAMEQSNREILSGVLLSRFAELARNGRSQQVLREFLNQQTGKDGEQLFGRLLANAPELCMDPLGSEFVVDVFRSAASNWKEAIFRTLETSLISLAREESGHSVLCAILKDTDCQEHREIIGSSLQADILKLSNRCWVTHRISFDRVTG